MDATTDRDRTEMSEALGKLRFMLGGSVERNLSRLSHREAVELIRAAYEIAAPLRWKALGIVGMDDEAEKVCAENAPTECNSDDPDDMCPNCDCWKSAREMCS